MTILCKRRLTALRFLLAALVTYLPLQSLYAQACCEDEVLVVATDAGSEHAAADCCFCCDHHDACGNGETCDSPACSHAIQFIPAVALDAFIPSAGPLSTGPPRLHSDSPPHREAKPPKRRFA